MSKPQRPEATIAITESQEGHVLVTTVEINEHVGLTTEDRYIHVSGGGREMRIGPLSVEQAEGLCEDLGYDGLA
jgi:hypothetical protein